MDVKSITGTLYLCATPIGNLEDVTLRVLSTLRSVDFIAAENISRTRKLLSRYDIHKHLLTYREEEREKQGTALMTLLVEGKSVALVSDAGVPGLSDPGHDLVVRCRAEGIPVTALPGPSAVLTALVLSGFSTSRFVFEGFLPRKRVKREELLKALATETRTIIFFEAPHRVMATLEECARFLGERRLCIARELTKTFEELAWGTPRELITGFTGRDTRGEITIVMEGATEDEARQEERAVDCETLIEDYQMRGFSLKDAAREISRTTGIGRREIYEKGLKREGKK
jgi:16S rRNA (cytidine1402-2'-O)-methyltransferase